MDGFDPLVQTTVMFAPAVGAVLAFVTTGSYALAESLQVLTTVTVMDSGAEAEPATVDRVDPSVIAISIKKKTN